MSLSERVNDASAIGDDDDESAVRRLSKRTNSASRCLVKRSWAEEAVGSVGVREEGCTLPSIRARASKTESRRARCSGMGGYEKREL